MNYDEFSEMLIQGMSELRIHPFPEEILDKFYKFYLFFLKWNKKINLSAHREEKESLEKNILDSLALHSYINPNLKILDFGSGGGFPGLVLKICNLDLDLQLVEADQKKSAFLEHAVFHLGLKNVRILNQYINSNNILKKIQNIECIVSRATMDFEILASLFVEILKPGQKIMAMVSPHLDEKSLTIFQHYQIEFVQSYELPFSHTPRKIISIIKL